MYTMGMRLLVALLLAATLGCAARADIRTLEPPTMSLVPYAIQVVGDVMIGSACAVETQVLTAKHVINPFLGKSSSDSRYTSGLSWSTPGGLRGYLDPIWAQWYRDVAGLELVLSNDIPMFWKRADKVKRGETVRWVEYTWEPGPNLLMPLEREGEIRRTVAGYIVFSGNPNNGSSGGCLWNEANEVVGIVVWGSHDGGLAVNLTGYWWDGK